MLLCVDIGNTNTVIGIYRGEKLIAHWRIESDPHRMPDEYGMLLLSFLRHRDIDPGLIRGACVACVVPPLGPTWEECLDRYIGCDVLLVEAGVRTGVRVRTDNPREVGADRVVNAAAAHRLYGGPACIIDFGTATTFDAINAEGDYLGGAIAPGVGIAAEALFTRTARLPRIEIRRPPKAIGTNTIHSMQSGLLFGYVGLVEGLVARFRAELGPEMRVIATGGLAPIIADETRVIDHVDPWLTLKGLQIIYGLNRPGGEE